MVHYLDEDFDEEYLNIVAKVDSEEYYVNMMIAWYFATALAKQFDATIPFLDIIYLENGFIIRPYRRHVKALDWITKLNVF